MQDQIRIAEISVRNLSTNKRHSIVSMPTTVKLRSNELFVEYSRSRKAVERWTVEERHPSDVIRLKS